MVSDLRCFLRHGQSGVAELKKLIDEKVKAALAGVCIRFCSVAFATSLCAAIGTTLTSAASTSAIPFAFQQWIEHDQGVCVIIVAENEVKTVNRSTVVAAQFGMHHDRDVRIGIANGFTASKTNWSALAPYGAKAASDLQTPRADQFWPAGVHIETSERIARDQWSVHYNI